MKGSGYCIRHSRPGDEGPITDLMNRAFGLAVRSLGRPLFFLMCLLMIPVATAELGTDGWPDASR